MSHSDLQGGPAAAHVAPDCTLDWRSGNIDADPGFIEPGAWNDGGTPEDPSDDVWGGGDHRLRSASPCIDTGTEDAMITEDMDEEPRPLLSRYDIGADEYSGLCWDGDGDGYIGKVCGGTDCDDSDPFVHPGAEEFCFNGIDDDCDGFVDSVDPVCVNIHVPGDHPTIQAAIDAADDGNTILVSAGTYVENINFLGKEIAVRSDWGADMTVIDGGAAGTVVSFVSGETEAVLDGFKITNGSGNSSGYAGGIICAYASPTIRSCWIMGNIAAHGGGIDIFQSSPRIENCMITENQAVYSGGGLNCEESSPEIIYCTISGNSADRGGGIYVEDRAFPSLANVILWGNSASEGPGIWVGTMGNPSTATVNYCNLEGGQVAAHVEPYCDMSWGAGNIEEDPLFMSSWDFHLNPGSPCIDAGTDAGINTDLDGDERPLLMGHDIGADEFDGSCWDLDGDGYSDEGCGGYDCDDSAPDAHPGALEVCEDNVDGDCDGLVDMDDPDCIPVTTTTTLPPTTTTTLPPGPAEFTLVLDASYVSGHLVLNYTIGTPVAATWANYLILTYPSAQVIPLWTTQLPAIDPPIDVPVSFPFQSLGWVKIYTGLYAAGNPEAEELVWVDTGAPAG